MSQTTDCDVTRKWPLNDVPRGLGGRTTKEWAVLLAPESAKSHYTIERVREWIQTRLLRGEMVRCKEPRETLRGVWMQDCFRLVEGKK